MADNEQDFASSCARLLTDSKLASRLVAGARGNVRRDYAAARATKVLLDRIDPERVALEIIGATHSALVTHLHYRASGTSAADVPTDRHR